MPRPRTDIQPRILHAARARFVDSGVDGASLRSIARDAKTSIGMVYYYYQTKDDLFLEVVEEVYVGFLRDIETVVESEPDFDSKVLALYRRIGGMSELELQTIRLVVREALTSSNRLDRLVERFKRGHVPLIVNTVLTGMNEGRLRSDLHPVVLVLSTVALGAFPQLVLRGVGHMVPLPLPDAKELPAQLLRVLLQGVAEGPVSKAEPTPIAD